MKIIIPCCGRSTRFPNLRPKWMLNAADGDMMVHAAISKFSLRGHQVIIAILAEVEEKYSVSAGLEKLFGPDLDLCLIDHPTRSQSETVHEVLLRRKITEPFMVKDSDNCFSADLPMTGGFVCYDNLQNHTLINAANKSYMCLNQDGIITKIVEKQVVSACFSVGGYGFSDPERFLYAYRELGESGPTGGELYLSHIINYLIAHGDVFVGVPVSEYEDWGTLEDWRRAKAGRKTYFVDLDGVVFENGAQFFPPYWGETPAISSNATALLTLEKAGNKLVFTTSRTEPYRQITEDALRTLGFVDPVVVMSCLNGQRVLVNDYSDSNPYPSAVAVNLPRNAPHLAKLLGSDAEAPAPGSVK